MDEITDEVRLREWSAAIAESNNSGMRKKDWCRLHGISEKQVTDSDWYGSRHTEC